MKTFHPSVPALFREAARRGGATLLASLVLASAPNLFTACKSNDKASGFRRGGPVPVVIQPAIRRDMPVEVVSIGTVEPVATVEIVSQVTGVVLEAHFKQGDFVKRGQLLFSIDTRPYGTTLAAARAQLEKDQALAGQADEEAERQRKLHEQGLSTEQDLSKAQATAASMAAALQGDKAQIRSAALNVQFAQIRSPIDGRTGSLLVYPGNVVKANDPNPLVVVRSLEPIDVRFSVPEEHLTEIRQRMNQGPLEVSVAPRGTASQEVTGNLYFVENTVDTATGTIGLKARFSNQHHALWPGQFVDVRLRLSLEKGATVVPEAAVQMGQQGSYAFVLVKDNKVRRRAIAVDRIVGSSAVVSKGISVGDRVVVDGQVRLTDGTQVVVEPDLLSSPQPSVAPSGKPSPLPSPKPPAAPPRKR